MTTNRDGDPAQPGGAARAEGTDHPTLQLLAEEVSVAKETLEIGRVRISTRTHERDALVDENLAREQVEIEKGSGGRGSKVCFETAGRAYWGG
jgi:stress response protein YsnF